MTIIDRRFLGLRAIIPLLAIVFAILLLPGASLYYSYSGGKSCTKCHEIWPPYRDWHESSHRNVACSECHGDVMTLDAGYHLKNLRQLVSHLRGNIPEQVHLKTDDVPQIEALRQVPSRRICQLVFWARTAPVTRKFS